MSICQLYMQNQTNILRKELLNIWFVSELRSHPVYSSTSFSTRLFNWRYFFFDWESWCPLLTFSKVISLALCSIIIFRISLEREGWVVFILISKALCRPCTELFVREELVPLKFHILIRNKGRRLLPWCSKPIHVFSK